MLCPKRLNINKNHKNIPLKLKNRNIFQKYFLLKKNQKPAFIRLLQSKQIIINQNNTKTLTSFIHS